nr:NusA: transcription termination factor [uncultured bacterium]
MYNGTVEIKAIAREPGSRSKVAVAARQPGIDPVGACVGLRGIRIQNIVSELNSEKIDVIEWHADTPAFVAKALSPAQVVKVDTNEEEKTAKVVVPDRQLSLAIGKEGQNARLAAKLTGWRIDIQALSVYRQEEAERLALEEEERAAAAAAAPPEPEVEIVSEPDLVPVIAEPELEPVLAELPAADQLEIPVEPVPVAAPVEYVIEEPVAVGAGVEKRQVRFAEEILTDIRDGKKKVKGKRDGQREEEEAARAPKKAQRRQRVYFEDDEEEEYEDILRRIK